MDRTGSWDQEYRTNIGGEQSTFTFALRGNGKRGIVHNPRRVVVLAIGNVGIVGGNCWRCGDVAVEGRKRRGDYGHGHGTKERFDANDGRNRGIWDVPAGCMAGWGLSDLSNRGCSSITILCW